MAKIKTCQERLNELFDSDPRSDSAIADYIGVSKQTISAWRNGSRSPKESTVKRIAELYDVDEAWLFGFDVESDRFSTSELRMKLDPVFINEVLGFEEKAKETKEHNEDMQILRIFHSLNAEGRAYLLQQADIAKKLFGGAE